jgi:hypothetical protein
LKGGVGLLRLAKFVVLALLAIVDLDEHALDIGKAEPA